MQKLIGVSFLCFALTACNPSSQTADKTDEPSSTKSGLAANLANAVETFEMTDDSHYCNYAGEKQSSKLYTFSSQTGASQVISDILQQIGLPSNFNVLASNVPNATAYLYSTGDKAGKRYVFYSAKYFLDVEDSTKTDWSRVSILCHEVGHHLAGHTLTKKSRPEMELEADKFSGFILRRMGATKRESILAIEKLGSEKGSATHPDKFTRTNAILAGWEEADYNEQQIAARRARMPAPMPDSRSKSASPRGQGEFNNSQIDITYSPPKASPKPPARKAPFKEFYIINTRAVKTEAIAKQEKEKLEVEGYKAGYLWIPDYPSLSGKPYYAIYIGPFFSQYHCELAVENYRKKKPDAYGVLVSMSGKRKQINGLGKSQ